MCVDLGVCSAILVELCVDPVVQFGAQVRSGRIGVVSVRDAAIRSGTRDWIGRVCDLCGGHVSRAF